MTTKKLISVTQKHINKGRRLKSDCCPVALAVLDGTEYKAVWISGGLGDGWKEKEGLTRYKLSMGRSVQRFVKLFDKKGKKAVKPFRFWLTIEG